VVVELQVAVVDSAGVPDPAEVESWVLSTFSAISRPPSGITVRVVDEDEIAALNQQFRNKNTPTNVLAFPFESVEEVEYAYLGDIVICLTVVKAESKQQFKSVRSHFAHMVIHGTLHLCGYDHQHDDEAEEMESVEQGILTAIESTQG
jgi:probable rRNA maturation factor